MADEEATIVGKLAVWKGFLAGSLFLISFFINTHMVFKALIFVYGLIVVLDGLLPSKQEQYYPISLFSGLLVGFVLSIVFYHYLGLYYVSIILVLATLMYIYRILEKTKSAAPRNASL